MAPSISNPSTSPPIILIPYQDHFGASFHDAHRRCRQSPQPNALIRVVAFVALALLPACCSAQNELDDAEVIAKVDLEVITEGNLQREMKALVGQRHLNAEQQRRARTATLQRLINQRVVFAFLKKVQLTASDAEVQKTLEALVADLKQFEKTLDDHLDEIHLTKPELEFQIAWQISWPRYLTTQLTDENLETHFELHRRQFDGTELRVAHLLLKIDRNTPRTQEKIDSAREQANAITKSISDNAIQWEGAVQQHSTAPTRASGGEIGWIGIKGPMPRSFTLAAFKLEENEISDPVFTPFGCHLIKCLEVKPGKIAWRDASDALKTDARRRLFSRISSQHREKTDIQFDPAVND